MIDLTVYEERLERALERARQRNIVIPTFAQQKNPALIPDSVKNELVSYCLQSVCQSSNVSIRTSRLDPVARAKNDMSER